MLSRSADPLPAAHDRVYRTLRSRIMHGEIDPGAALTLRGIGKDFGVSMTPAREAVRRLVAEGALTLSNSGRVSTPELSNERIEELAALRALIETELASRALPRAHLALIDRLQTINNTIAEAIAKGDAVAYIRANLEFHSVSAPSATSLRTASRAGVIETPKSLPIPLSVNAAPGSISPCMMRDRSVR